MRFLRYAAATCLFAQHAVLAAALPEAQEQAADPGNELDDSRPKGADLDPAKYFRRST